MKRRNLGFVLSTETFPHGKFLSFSPMVETFLMRLKYMRGFWHVLFSVSVPSPKDNHDVYRSAINGICSRSGP